jgi:hypothetical protein
MPELKPLTYDEAVAMLPDGEYVHTYAGSIGADWGREKLLLEMQQSEMHLADKGSFASATRHNLIVVRSDGRKLAVEIKRAAV